MNHGVNTKGRVIHKGPRGGFYVLQDGKKVYRFTPAVLPRAVTGGVNLNTKGRVIHKGSRGGFYVLQDGKKVYRFKRALPPPPTRVKTPVANVLKKLLQSVRKRTVVPKISNLGYKITRLEVEYFNHTDNHFMKPKYSDIKVPFSKNPNVNKLFKNGTIMTIDNDYLPTQVWIDAQVKYLEYLSDYDLQTAMAYTVRSHEWIGPWLRGDKSSVKFTLPNTKKFIVPLFPQVNKLVETKNFETHTWVKQMLALTPQNKRYTFYKSNVNKMPKVLLEAAMKLYVSDLKRIVRNAPPLTRPMYVFRGLSKDIFKGKLGTVHTIDQFSSAAYVPQYLYSSGQYMRIKLLRGTRVLLLQALNHWDDNGEFEILINKGARYIIRKRNLQRPVINRSNGYVTRQNITDVTVYN